MISKEEIRELAALARLKLSVGEEDSLQKDISNILEYVGQVNSVVAGTGPGHSLLKNVMRDDAVRTEGDPLYGKRDALLAALPAREGDHAVVRKIIDKDE